MNLLFQSVSGPGALPPLSVAVSVLGPGALYVGARRSLCPAPKALCVGPGALCVGARRSPCRAWRSLAVRLCVALCVGPGALCRAPALLVSGPVLCVGARCVGARRSLCRGPTAGPQLRSACHPSSPARSLFPGENPKASCLGQTMHMHSAWAQNKSHNDAAVLGILWCRHCDLLWSEVCL